MNLIPSAPTSPKGPLELAPAEVGIHDPAPECEGEIAARESLEPEGPQMPAKAMSAGCTERLDRAERRPFRADSYTTKQEER